MSAGTPTDVDILVVGAGPSGLVVSCEAVRAGARVLTLDKRNGPTWARAGNLMPRPLELLACRGLLERVLQRAGELHRDPRSTHGIWAGLPGLDYARCDTEHPYLLWLAQIETEKLLADHLTEIGGDLRLQHEVLEVAEQADHVRVAVRLADGTVRHWTARYVVGADGNRSAVRQSVGIDWVGHPIRRYAFNVDAHIANPFPRNLTVFHSPAGWALTYPLSDAVTRFALIDAQTCEQPRSAPPDEAEAMAMLRRVHGTDHGIRSIQAVTQFHDAMYRAAALRRGRVFLVGESVRVHYPASGVGMNFCIQDAFNLGWKIGGVAAGWLREPVLDSYVREREPELVRFLDNVRRQCAIQFHFDEEHEALKRFLEHELITQPSVNRQLCATLAGLDVRYPVDGGQHPLLGTRLTNLRLLPADAGDATRVFDALQAQCFVLLDVQGHGRQPLAHPRLRQATLDPRDRATLAGIDTLLLRPDGHVAWLAPSAGAGVGPQTELGHWLSEAPQSLDVAA